MVENSSAQLLAAVKINPVAVAIEADQLVFEQYSSGILDSSLCGSRMDHAVTVVGYGNDGTENYYIVRNSWGPYWGDKGYVKISSTTPGAGVCGI